VRESLERLVLGYGTYQELLVPKALIQHSPDELMDLRADQIASMARYGRQSWNVWDDMPLSEFYRALGAMSRLMSKEDALNGASEEHG